MSSNPIGRKVDALLWLAGGKSNRVAAEAAGVSPSTVAAWKRDPQFAAELADLKQMYETKPLDGQAFMDRLDEAQKRLTPPTSPSVGVRQVRVRVPAGASPEEVRAQARRAVARAIARDMKATVRRVEP
ncbi:helix-turn-helix domain-containing protein [Streptomyces sviceus]|uniref:helix-turn-helix domain-containing protein n=1 Tax=Streptomyces sviceus TaxID=285530 RepID=UPI003826E8A5